jgi:hypothetical protein
MSKILKLNDSEPALAPDHIYYELYERIINTYRTWATNYLQGADYLVELEKIKIKVAEANNAIIKTLDQDFTIQGEWFGKDN